MIRNGKRNKQSHLLNRNLKSRVGVGDGQADARRRGKWPPILVAEAAHAGADGLLADLQLEDEVAAAD
jgi:hypothetical protein